MVNLSNKDRRRLPAKDFGESGDRKYPMPDRVHAGNAKARAAAQVKAGTMSRAEQRRINAKADRLLYAGSRRDQDGRVEHVFLVDDEGKHRTKVRPDEQPKYKIKPAGVRRDHGKPKQARR